MTIGRRIYTREFRLEAVHQLEKSGRSTCQLGREQSQREPGIKKRSRPHVASRSLGEPVPNHSESACEHCNAQPGQDEGS